MFGRIREWLSRGCDPDPVTLVDEGDEALNDAKAQARATLDAFWAKLDAGAAEIFQVKAGLTTPDGAVEHIWLEVIGRRDGKVVGRLMNQPVDLDDVSLGDEVEVDPDRISDWGYFKNGRLYGAYTQRVLLTSLPARSRRDLEAVLAPTPLEPDA